MKKTLFISSLLNSVARKRLGILQQLLALVFGFGNCAFGQTATFSYTGALQSYTVPSNITAIYIQANGAQGGNTTTSTTSAAAGGLGAQMSGIFNVTPGHVLNILVGQQPAAAVSDAGGGGGTFVWDVTAGNVLLTAAGGGGGATAQQSNNIYYNGINAVTTINGTGGGGGTGGAGVNGYGATAVNYSTPVWAGGGAGWLSNGSKGKSTVGDSTNWAGGGASPLNGGAGGNFGGKTNNNRNGGYGGGGGGQGNFVFFGGGGGGGGYSGGAGGAEVSPNFIEPGGGGGSYSSGCSQSNSVANTGNGLVVITVAQLYFVNCSPQSLTVCKNSTSNSINSLLAIHDLTSGLTETWSVASGPSHGTLDGFNATGTSTSGNVSPSGLTYTPSTDYTGSDVFTIQVSDGTYTATTTIGVTIEAPAISAGANRAICFGASTTLTASGGISYIWIPSTELSASTGSTLTANPSTTTTYTATGTDGYGCTNTATVTVTVNPLPTAYSVTGGGCSAGSGATIGLDGSQSGVNYQLKRGSTSVGSPIAGTGNAITFGTTFTTAGTYTVMATYTTTSCASNMTGSAITSSTLPTVTSPASYAVCAGTSTSLSGSGAVSYSWSGGISNGISFTPTAIATYTVTGTGSNGCTNTSATTISVNPLPAAITGATTIYPATTALLSDGTTDGTWSSNNITTATIGSSNGVVTGAQIGTATISYTLLTGCYVTQNVMVAPFPPNGIGLGTAPTGPNSSSAIFSLRKMSSDYSGYAINVRRSSDNATQDIGFDAYGNFDTASLKAFCGSGSGFVTSWYDQSGYGLNASQGTTGNQPQIVNSGVIYRQNGLPSVYFNGTYLLTPSFAGLSSGFTTCVVAGVQTDVTYNTFGARNSAIANPGIPNPFDSYNGTIVIGDGISGDERSYSFITGMYAASGFGQWTMGADPSQVVAWRYGSSNIVSGSAPAYYTDGNVPLYLGTRADFVSGLNGYISEYTLFPTVLPTADRQTVECNQFTYYNSISGNSSVCAGSAITLTATYPGGSWSSSNNDVATAGNTGIVSAVAAGSATITYTVTNPSCGSATNFTKTITVNPVPEVTSPANLAICAGASTALTGGGAVSYSWTGGITDGTTFTPTATATYTVTGTNAIGCTNTSATTVTVNALPTVTAPSNYAICAGASTALTGGGAVSYSWTGGITDGSSFTPTATATYTVTGTDGNGCVNTSITTVTVNALPTVTAPSNYAICAGASTALTGSGAVSYSWTGGIANGTTFTPTATATYIVTGTDGNGCVNTSITTVTVNALPTVTAPSNYAVCAGASTSLSGSGAVSYSWTGGITNGTTFTPTATATYTVTGTDANGCMNRSTTTVTVNNSPTVTAPSNYAICAGASTSLSGSGAVSYSWTGGITNGTTFTPAATANYTVTGTDANGCMNRSTTTVTVNNSPTVTAPSNYAICAGASTSLSGSGAVSYSWTGGITNGTTFTPAATANYTVTGTDANGCMNRSTTTVTVNNSPTVTAPSNYAICAGASTSLSGSGAVSYSWTGGIANGITFTPTATATYTVTGTDANGCMNRSTTTVTVNNSPTVTAPSNYAICVGASTSLSGSGAVSYSWTGGIANGITFTPTATTTYTVTGTDANGCMNRSTTTVTVNALPSVSAGGNQTVCRSNSSTNNSITLVPAPGSGGIWTATSGTFSGNTYSNTTSGTATVSYSYTDSHSCTNSGSATITILSTYSITATTGSNGSISPSGTANICSGANQVYTITPASGYHTSSIIVDGSSIAVANTYTFTSVSAAHTISATFALSCTAPSITSSATTTASACYGGSTGSVTTYASGSTPLTYAWSNGASSASLSNVAAGTYTYTVTNSCGSASGSATVSQPGVLSATLTPTSPSCNSAVGGNHNNGSISATVSGGTSPYSYSWSNSQTGASNTGLAAGTYSVTVTDAHSCSATRSATVSQPAAVSSTITGSSNALGGTTSTFSGPSGLSYSWSITGGDHICDSKCHHNSSHSCGSGCDHYGHSCTSACHHHSSHVCSHQHYGDHHCNIYCHHNSGHSCNANCDHYGHSCTSACHHNSNHKCDHSHCGGAAISGSATGSAINIDNPCCASTYTLTLTTTSSGGCTSTSTVTVTVTPSAIITVYSSLYTTGSGNHPSVAKSALATSLKVFTRSAAGHRDGSQSHYSSVWNSTTGLVTNVSISTPIVVNIGGGPAYQYSVTVPADGRYLVVGKASISSSYCSGGTCTVYSGKKLGANDGDDDDHGHDDDDDDDLDPCSTTKVRFNTILKDNTGKCSEGDTHQEHGSLMLVVTPTTLTFDDSTSLLPVVYESVEGDWLSSVTADPPYGFYATPNDALSASVTDSVMDAVQFVITDTGSEWTNTKLTHTIQHKGAQRIAYSRPAMVNQRTNKPSVIDVVPNPAVDRINITLPKFEGHATIYVYNSLGQAVVARPVEIANGESVSMDISQLPNGVYLISAENPAGKASTRLIRNGK